MSPVEQELLTLPEHLCSLPVYSGIRVTQYLVLCVCFVDRCLSFCTFSLCHCGVCSLIYWFWLLLWYHQTLLCFVSFLFVCFVLFDFLCGFFGRMLFFYLFKLYFPFTSYHLCFDLILLCFVLFWFFRFLCFSVFCLFVCFCLFIYFFLLLFAFFILQRWYITILFFFAVSFI